MKAIVTVGIPCSGKSTWAEEFIKEQWRLNCRQWHNVNRDDIRFEIFCKGERNWAKYKWKNESKVTDIQYSEIELVRGFGHDVIISDTNINPKYRKLLIAYLEKAGFEVEIKEFPISLEEAWKRDARRANGVGHSVIARMYGQWLKYKGRKQYVQDWSLPQTVIVDVDGTVARMAGRGPFHWDKVGEDEPIEEVIDIVVGLKRDGYKIVFLSGRDGCCYDETKQWLDINVPIHFSLYMREAGDNRKDSIIKEELLWNELDGKCNVCMAIDDRPVMCRTWQELGIKTINVGDPWIEF